MEIDKQRDVKVSPAGFVDLVLGKTLVIRFGALPTTVGYVTVTPNPAQVAIGGTQQMTAVACDLHNATIGAQTTPGGVTGECWWLRAGC